MRNQKYITDCTKVFLPWKPAIAINIGGSRPIDPSQNRLEDGGQSNLLTDHVLYFHVNQHKDKRQS